ncbi:hypothetical protein SBA6_1340013 [Candidatus Sulfopaludibacter sp. SbA6]|nr:hypothetical protein SBA6_1340013 [Candidatus Sulfopaludibacter sp. SbA6]
MPGYQYRDTSTGIKDNPLIGWYSRIPGELDYVLNFLAFRSILVSRSRCAPPLLGGENGPT